MDPEPRSQRSPAGNCRPGRRENLRLWAWDLDTGLRTITTERQIEQSADQQSEPAVLDQPQLDPLSAVRLLGGIAANSSPALLVLENFHRFLDSAEICQALLTQISQGKQLGRHLIILSPVLRLPPELDRQFAVLEHPLPGREQLWEIAAGLIESSQEYAAPERESLLDASAGLTCSEAESAYSLSLVRHGRIVASEIWQLKAQWLKKSGLLRLYQSQQGFETLGGLENLKQFCRHSLRRLSPGSESISDSGSESDGPLDSSTGNKAGSQRRAQPRGIMLLGVPGTGKSAFAKALGKETDRPVLMLDVGQLMGSLVGQSEANIRTALKIADAMAPCILFIDEVEKGLSGASGATAGDSGVASRLFGTLLTCLNDHTSQVYVVVTCNNIQQLPPGLPGRTLRCHPVFGPAPALRSRPSGSCTCRSISSMRLSPGPATIAGPARDQGLLPTGQPGRLAQQAGQYIVPVGVTAAGRSRASRLGQRPLSGCRSTGNFQGQPGGQAANAAAATTTARATASRCNAAAIEQLAR